VRIPNAQKLFPGQKGEACPRSRDELAEFGTDGTPPGRAACGRVGVRRTTKGRHSTGGLSGNQHQQASAPEEFALVGFASGDPIAFSVKYGKHGSLTTWAGQRTVEGKTEKICKLWHLAQNIPNPDEPDQLWSGILACGANDRMRRHGGEVIWSCRNHSSSNATGL
jgi:hypothetical protein